MSADSHGAPDDSGTPSSAQAEPSQGAEIRLPSSSGSRPGVQVSVPYRAGDAGVAQLPAVLRATLAPSLGNPALLRPELHVDTERARVLLAYEGARGGRLEPDPATLARTLRQLVHALAPLHEQGVAHGHLRPELVWVGEQGTLVVAGFAVSGLALHLGGPTYAARLLPDAHRPPEQNGPFAPRPQPCSDVFAAGILFLYWLTGDSAVAADAALAARLSPAVVAALAPAFDAAPDARPRLTDWAEGVAKALEELTEQRQATPRTRLLHSSATSLAASPVLEVAEPTAEPAELAQPTAEPTVEPAEPTAEPTEPAVNSPASAAPVTRHGHGEAEHRRERARVLAVLAAVLGFVLLLGAGISAFAYRLMRGPSTVANARHGPPPNASYSVPPAPVAPAPGPLVPVPTQPPLSSDGLRLDSGGHSSPPTTTERRLAEHALSALPVEASTPVWGPPTAAVTMMLFGDFECPYTRRALLQIDGLKRVMGSELRVVWRNRPLPGHSGARALAQLAAGAHAALGDRAFWELAVSIASASDQSAERELELWAKSHGASEATLRGWASEAASAARVDADLALAGRFEVRGTPTYFVNGSRSNGEQPLRELHDVLLRESRISRSAVTLGLLPEAQLYPLRVSDNLLGLGPELAERSCVPLGTSPARGASKPLLTLVEFSDFECDYCRTASETVQQLLGRYAELRHVWKSFPLPNHARARPAAAFAFAVLEQHGNQQFWNVHQQLFSAEALDNAALSAIAERAGLDAGRLLGAAGAVHTNPRIDLDLEIGSRAGVEGAPTFFLNGRKIAGAQPLEHFEEIIREELALAKRLLKAKTPPGRVYEAFCGEPERALPP